MGRTLKPRRQDPEVRRAQILEAAARSFRSHGLQGSTVDRIAAEAGVSVGLLYRFFASKAAIVEAIVAADLERQLAQAIALLKEAARRPEALPELVGAHLAKDRIDREHFALQFEITAEACRNTQLRTYIRAKRSELIDALSTEVREWGEGRPSAEFMLESLDLAGAVASGLAMHAAIYSDEPRLARDVVMPLVDAIFTRRKPRTGVDSA